MPKDRDNKFRSYVVFSDQSRYNLQSNGIHPKLKEFVVMSPKTKDEKRQVRKQILRKSPFILSRRDIRRACMAARRKLKKGNTGIRLFEVAIPFDKNQQKEPVYFKGVARWLAISSTSSETSNAKGSARGKYLFVGYIPSEYIREISWRTK